MLSNVSLKAAKLRMPVLLGLALLCSACTSQRQMNMFDVAPMTTPALETDLPLAIANAKALKSQGKRVWCVPFARDASGLDIRGNAGTWWDQAKDKYVRSSEPVQGAVMAFSSTRKLPMGHVAVVSEVVSDREVLIDHANWSRSKISLGMKVVDVSAKGDWSAVRVASDGNSLGRVYPIDGFISNNRIE
jgi:hypothetical protein